ncbi:Vesicle-mediated ER to Golgi transport protein [Dispira simplex]|nr:Vesicle-mediated ER to Golgi transport protein [Dispira simplex]
MEFLSRGYSVLVGETGQTQSPTETIHRLADRAAHSTLIEDRRAAILSLKGLSREYKSDVGHEALTALLEVLAQDREDIGIVKPILETLNTLCARDSRDNPPTLGPEFAEQLLRTDDHIELLLDIMEHTDFYVRFNAVQLLATLQAALPGPLQNAILVLPMGVGRLMDLLNDRRDIIRNEALLLLIDLSEQNADIQKIVAFQGAFERLLEIIEQEGGIRGGIVVQDCLQLMHNLLRYNVSNQNFFRETSCIHRLPELFSTEMDNFNIKPYEQEEEFQWSEQNVGNAVYLLQMVRLLVVPGNLNTTANQDTIYHCDMFSPLVQLCLSPDTPQPVKAETLYCLGDVIRGNARNQDVFMRTTITVVPDQSTAEDPKLIPEPVIVSIVAMAVGTSAEYTYTVRSAATYLTLCYVHENVDTQLALASTLTPPPSDNPNSHLDGTSRSAGSLLITTLLRCKELELTVEPFQVWYAATILGHILADNTLCKQVALKVRWGEHGQQGDGVPLLQCLVQCLMRGVEDSIDTHIPIGLLTLLCMWVYDSPPTVAQLLQEPGTLQFLIEQVSRSMGVDPIVQGLTAMLFGLVYQFNEDPSSTVSRQDMEPVLKKRIGVDIILSRIGRLRDSPAFQNATLFLTANLVDQQTHLPELYLSQGFTTFFRARYEAMQQALTSRASDITRQRAPGPSESSAQETGITTEQHQAQVQSLQNIIDTQHQELSALQAKIGALEENLAQSLSEFEAVSAQLADKLPVSSSPGQESEEMAALRSCVNTLEINLQEQEEKYTQLEKEQEDLLVYLAEQDTQCKEYRKRLRELGEALPSSDDEDDDDELGDEVDEDLAGDDLV